MSYTETEVDWSTIYEALAQDGRREVVRYLANTSGDIDIHDLANHLLVESDLEETDANLHRVTVELHHVDIPKLRQVGLIEDTEGDETLSATELVYELPLGILSPPALNRGQAQTPEQADD